MDSNAGTGRTGHELWTAMRGLEEQLDYGQQYGDWVDWRNRTWIVDSNVGDDGLWPTIRRLEVCAFVCSDQGNIKGANSRKFCV